MRVQYSSMLLAGVSLMALPHAALAQEATPTTATGIEAQASPANDGADGQKDIVVTGSRVVRDGSKSPSPVTVLSAGELTRTAPSNIADGLNQLPQFSNSVSQTSYGQTNANTPSNGNYLNLRGIGPARALILFDGRRLPPTSFDGSVDVNTLPQMLVQRVDVVTAGASATYGSDAVSGVVNYVLDKTFTGVKYTLQKGVSTRGDAPSLRAGVAVGTGLLGDRAHLIASFEHYDSAGIFSRYDRRYAGNLYSLVGAGTAANPYVTAANTRLSFSSFGGLLPALGLAFQPGGALTAFNGGTATGNPSINIGGDGAYFDQLGLTGSLKTNQAFARLSMDVAPGVNAFVQGSYADSRNIGYYGSDFHFGSILFSPTNAFLSAQQQAQLTAASGGAPITMSRYSRDLGQRVSDAFNRSYNVTAGVDGRFGDYRWNLAYSHGRTQLDVKGLEVNNQKFYAALDAVRDGSGNIVCRVSLTNPGLYPGCVPLNLFGEGSPSAAAVAYVNDYSRYRVVNELDVVSGSISGSPFSSWAGPVSVAVGGEYRRQSLVETSNSDPGVATDFTGIRFVPSGTLGHSFTNVGSAKGRYDVKEVFGEVDIPLAKDSALGRSLNLNGAVRYTDYSTSGGVTTWKAGLVYQPVDDLVIRATRSRDIRAPTLYDLFASRSINVFGLSIPGVGNFPTQAISGGNAALKPEKGLTTSAGFVYSPSWLPGARLAIDYFDLKLRDAITVQDAQQAYDDCQASGGNAPVCNLIVRTSGSTVPTAILVSPLNSASLRTRGFDFESSYTFGVGQGQLALRAFASYVPVLRLQTSATQPAEELAGTANTSVGGNGAGYPKWRGNLSVNYANGGFNLNVQERWIGRYDRSTRASYVIADASNRMPNVFYTDLNISYDVAGGRFSPFVNVRNLFDRQAPLYASALPGLSYPANQSLHDVVGRYVTFGIRGKF
ncbi:iron complex outermembrane receptor protein [Sphingomonas sp. SORGH_AS 950]|uniref:TonB-dependent receptor domain-containing protein n=1 Tax=Sphingomonas sp. SORGH_AS_0950 TaxID=3041792 RepID=UPI002781BD16|nr:TonB-dependent receptor [Sphingomonas sp. SORGH_AS_0950]MDQ1159302.1 iron complex outermembrane receptor protein [Sphingomonas sp. SORGH_AS_0950]